MTVIVSTTNVGLLRSCWDAAFTTPDWSWFLTSTRYSLMNCCLFLSTRSTRSHLMGAAWLISWQRSPWSYTINWCHVSRCCRPKQLMSMLSTCHSACIQQQAYALRWLQWATTMWIHVMLSLKDSRHGLSSIYSFFLFTSRNVQHSTLLTVLRSSTETHSEISTYVDSAWTLFFSSSSLYVVTLLSASMFSTEEGRVYHPNTTTFRWCGVEVSRADEVGQLACPPEFVQIQQNPVLLWVSQVFIPEFFLSQGFIPEFFLSQIFMSEFSSSRFSLPVRLSILLKMMLWSTGLSIVGVTEHRRKKTRREVNCLPWLDSFLLWQEEHSSRSFTRTCSFFKQVWKNLWKLTDKRTSLWSMPTLWVRDTAEFISFLWTWFLMGQNFDLLVRHVFVCIAFMNVLTWYSAEQRHVSQLRGDTFGLVIDDKEVTIFRTSSAGPWRRVCR